MSFRVYNISTETDITWNAWLAKLLPNRGFAAVADRSTNFLLIRSNTIGWWFFYFQLQRFTRILYDSALDMVVVRLEKLHLTFLVGLLPTPAVS